MFHHFTCATDTDQIKVIFEDVVEHIKQHELTMEVLHVQVMVNSCPVYHDGMGNACSDVYDFSMLKMVHRKVPHIKGLA